MVSLDVFLLFCFFLLTHCKNSLLNTGHKVYKSKFLSSLSMEKLSSPDQLEPVGQNFEQVMQKELMPCLTLRPFG